MSPLLMTLLASSKSFCSHTSEGSPLQFSACSLNNSSRRNIDISATTLVKSMFRQQKCE